jgi:hypothetical protein
LLWCYQPRRPRIGCEACEGRSSSHRHRRRFRRWHKTPRRQCPQTFEPQIVYRPVSLGQLPNDMRPFQRSFPGHSWDRQVSKSLIRQPNSKPRCHHDLFGMPTSCLNHVSGRSITLINFHVAPAFDPCALQEFDLCKQHIHSAILFRFFVAVSGREGLLASHPSVTGSH